MKESGMMVILVIVFSAVAASSQSGWTAAEDPDAGEGWLEKRGVTLEAVHAGEFWANVRGGLTKAQTYIHNTDITASLDTRRLGLWNDGKLFIYVLSSQGGTLLTDGIVGDSQTVSNIEAPHSIRLYEMWYEHLLFDGKLSLLMGIHDLNSEFAAARHGSLFINSSFGISKDISGGARPSIFPLAAPALRTRYVPNESWEFLLGVYNGDPGDPAVNRHFPRFTFDSRGGALIGFETVNHFSRNALPGTLKAGYWRNTGWFEDVLEVDSAGDPIVRRGNQGVYLVADTMISETEDGRGLAGFLQLGWAPDENINEFGSYLGGGLKYTGLIPHRTGDEAGIAVAHAWLSNKLASGGGRDGAETTLEITYKAVINEHFALQPDVQIVFNPGADSTLKNAVVAGARLEISF